MWPTSCSPATPRWGMLSPLDKKYLVFGTQFEKQFIGQKPDENRSIEETLDIGWKLLGLLPREELDRIDTKILDHYYHPTEFDAAEEARSEADQMAARI